MNLRENLENEKSLNDENLAKRNINKNFVDAMENYLKSDIIKINDIASIDRIEENKFAVCELLDGKMIDIELEKFGFEVKSGDVVNIELEYKDGNISNIVVKEKNEEERKRRIELVQERIRKLRERNGM